MDTVFTFKATKSTDNGGIQYKVDLGQDILEGMSEDTVKAYAIAHAKVELQNRKGALLRQSDTVDGAQSVLRETFGYPEATVEVYVATTKPKVLTVDSIRKAIASGKLTKQDIENMLNA